MNVCKVKSILQTYFQYGCEGSLILLFPLFQCNVQIRIKKKKKEWRKWKQYSPLLTLSLAIQIQNLLHDSIIPRYFPLIKTELEEHVSWLSGICLADWLATGEKFLYVIFSRIKKLTMNSPAMSRSQYPKEKIKHRNA